MLGELSDRNKLLGSLNSELVLGTKHLLADGKHLLISRDGLLEMLEAGEERSKIHHGGSVPWMGGAKNIAVVVNSFRVTGKSLIPLMQPLKARPCAP